MIDAVTDAVAREDFAALDAFERDYRGEHGTTPSGFPKLDILHATIAEKVGQEMSAGSCVSKSTNFLERWKHEVDLLRRWERVTNFLQRWEHVSSNSPAQIIARARLLQMRAWCFRGDTYASKVPREAWQAYSENIAAALEVLEKGHLAASVDPEYYVLMLDLYLAQGRPRAQFDRLMDKASDRFPYYYKIYFTAYRANQPRWGGSLEVIDEGARYAVTKTTKRDGTSVYFRIFYHTAICNCEGDLEAMDWPTMKTAMADIASRYAVDWTYWQLIRMSCLQGDADEARKYFDLLTINELYSWYDDDWKACRTLVGRSADVAPG